MSTVWVMHFEGGAWCYNTTDCATRATTTLGSSSQAAATKKMTGGPVSSDRTTNKYFANANRVIVLYCDGSSFSGDASHPVYVGGKPIYFRGKAVLEAIMEDLVYSHDMKSATEVLVSGSSAGGLTTLLHADTVHTLLTNHGLSGFKFRAAPVSGFFLMHDTNSQPVSGGHPIGTTFEQIQQEVFSLHNMTSAMNSDCIRDQGAAENHWRCFMANYSYAYSSTPMFLMQSALDSWQIDNIYGGLSPKCSTYCKANKDCVGHGTTVGAEDFQHCTGTEISALNRWLQDFVSEIKTAKRPGEGVKYLAAGSGGFVETCSEHIAADTDVGFTGIEIDGFTMQDALINWWKAEETTGAKHWHWPCSLSTTSPYQCNPTCSALGR